MRVAEMYKKWALPVIALVSVLLPSVQFAANPLSPGAPVQVTTSGLELGNVVTPPVVSGNGSGFMTTFTISAGAPPGILTAFSAFSINDGGSWTNASINPLQLTASPGHYFPTWVSGTAAGFMASWVDLDTEGKPPASGNYPYTSLYPPGGPWGSPDEINSSEASSLFTVISGTSADFVVTWLVPPMSMIFSFYSGISPDNGMTWNPVSFPEMTLVSAPILVSGFGPKFMAVANVNMGNITPFISTNGTSWSLTAAAPMPVALVNSDIWVSGTAAGFMLTWQDNAGNAYSSFSADDGTTWSTPSPIASGLAGGTDVVVSGSDVGYVVTWVDGLSNDAYASFSSDQGTNWSTPVNITNGVDSVQLNASSNFADFVGVSVVGNNVMFTWLSGSNVYSSFSTLGGVPSVLQPPQNPSGSKKKNNFGTFIERFNLLQWGPSLSTGVAGYYVYRSGVKIATLSASASQYEDHNQKKGAVTSYAITAFDAAGNESAPVDITIN